MNSVSDDRDPRARAPLMRRIAAGAVGGIAATCVLSAVMLLTGAWLREPDVIGLLARLLGQIDQPYGSVGRAAGWLMHFIIGVGVWGIVFGLCEPLLPKWSHALKGLLFGLAAGVLMIIMFLPPLGFGITSSEVGPRVEVTALALHAVYGLVLGFVYGTIAGSAESRRASPV